VNFGQLLRSDVIAAVAALVLLFVMALDWYSTVAGKEARRIEVLSQPSGAAGQVEREVRETARFAAEGAERNAWQVTGAVDRIILLGLLATVLLALGAAYLRAAGKRFRPPSTPSALAAVAAALTAVLVAYCSLQEPGIDQATTVEAGLPLALAVLGVIALSCRAAMREEERGTAWREEHTTTGASA